jgi:uracil-DNA glycosylase
MASTAMTKLQNLYASYDADPKFGYLRESDINLVPGSGSLKPSVMIIGEAPGSMENARQIPFVGPAGVELGKLLERAGIDASDTFMTNIVKYWTRTVERRVRPPTDVEVALSKPYLLEEIEIVSPRFIALCGRTPIRTFFPNVPSVRTVNGTLLKDRFVPLYHPAVVLYKREKYEEVLSGYRTLAALIGANNGQGT